MGDKLCFLYRRVSRDAEPFPRNVAVLSVSLTAKSPHYIFPKMYHSLDFHPEANRYLLDSPIKFRHVMVSLTAEQHAKYWNIAMRHFHFKGVPLKAWTLDISTLTSKYILCLL